jgi:hypothetical protein
LRKVLVLILILAIGCTALSNIAGFFESIPKPVKTIVGIGVAILGVSWAYTWFFDPIVILVENPFGAVSFGPFIVFDQKNWTAPKNWVWNHEYSHYCQYAFFGPAMLPLYLVSAGYSLLTTGNIWDNNPWESYPMDDFSPPCWDPQFIIRFGDGYE